MTERYTVVINDEGTFWYKEGTDVLHRVGGPAAEYKDGRKSWCRNGKLHREDGPAIERADGSKSWWLNGKRHREDGPSVECGNGHKEWHLHGNWLSEREWKRRMNRQKVAPLPTPDETLSTMEARIASLEAKVLELEGRRKRKPSSWVYESGES